jgi:hypothetical protein
MATRLPGDFARQMLNEFTPQSDSSRKRVQTENLKRAVQMEDEENRKKAYRRLRALDVSAETLNKRIREYKKAG